MVTPEEYKELGAKAYKDGDFNKAITEWTNAISASANENRQFLKVIYSNRSAAYLKLNQYTSALTDGEKCINLDSTWAKGYTRKGDALYALSRYTDAFNAYNTGIRIASSNEKESLQIKAEQAMRAIRGQNDNSNDGGYGRNSSSTSSSTTSTIFTMIQKYLRICIFISLFCYCIPFSRYLSFMSARFLSICAIIVRASVLYQKYGMVQFNMDYAGRVLNDSAGMGLFLATLLLASKPYLLALISVALVELSFFTPDLGQYGRANLPMLQAQLGPMLAQYGQSLLRGADPNRVLADLFSTRSVNMINGQLISGSAYCEVLQGVYILFEMILPTRNLMFAMLWWQYLQMRYMLDQSGAIKTAFSAIDQQITGMLTNRLCPPFILSLYIRLKAYLAKRVEPPAAGGNFGRGGTGLGSALSQCTIM